MFSNKNGYSQECINLMKNNVWTQQLFQKWCIWDRCTWKWTVTSKKEYQLTTDCNYFKIFENAYCFWTLNKRNINTSMNQSSSQKQDNYSPSHYCNFLENLASHTIRSRKRKISLPNIDGNLIKILSLFIITLIFLSSIQPRVQEVFIKEFHSEGLLMSEFSEIEANGKYSSMKEASRSTLERTNLK